MTSGTADREALERLDSRLKTLLPETYQDRYEDVQPVSMGSAGLKYDEDGRVAWHEIWQSFCDLAMAGGPPHKGALLEPATRAAIDAEPARYDEVVKEICRAVTLVADLWARPAPDPGWVRVTCFNDAMAGWLLRAIVMENVSARSEGATIDLPAGPHYRLEKEIKNVVTVVAKTCHYWVGHMPPAQHRAIGALFADLAVESPLVTPGAAGWQGVECSSVRAAVWIMRALVASNVLSRREGTTVFVPNGSVRDPQGAAVLRALTDVRRLAAARGVL